MSNSSSSYDLNNEQLLLINILNTMYNDNIRQIYNCNDTITLLNQTNTQIRNLLFQIFYNSNNNNQNQNQARINRENYGTNVHRNTNGTNVHRNSNLNNFGRVILNNIPYVVENVEEYRIPVRRDRNETINTNFSQILQNFFQPVEIFPTQTQLEIATRIVRYCDIISPLNRSCPISLENFNDTDLVTIIRFCGHIFNTDEFNTWFRSNCRCPVCRYDIRTFHSNSSRELFGDVTTNETNLAQNSNDNVINEQQNYIPNVNVERNIQTNNIINNNNSTQNTLPLINRLLNNLAGQENDVINLFTDLSGNLLNNITNSDSLLRLFNAVNNNYSI
jgi:hypothetical protein